MLAQYGGVGAVPDKAMDAEDGVLAGRRRVRSRECDVLHCCPDRVVLMQVARMSEAAAR